MSFVFSRSGIRAEWQTALPFNNKVEIRIKVDTGLEDDTRAFDITRNTHLWILYHAASLLEHEGAAGRMIHTLVRPWNGALNDDFHDALSRGLWDADRKRPYNSPILDLVPTWSSHFYDPDTRTNWLGQTAPTALTEGSRYFRESQRAYQDGNMEQAGYTLGLAVHYLSDLTQPMHASNFTWIDSQAPGFHTDFERYAKSVVSRVEPPVAYAPLLRETDLEAFFHAVARYSKDTYYSLICRPEWTMHYSEADRDEKVWDSRVGAVLPSILGDAVQMTAQFLLMWPHAA